MRPTYETAQDRTNEQQVIDLLCRVWSCTAEKTPRYYPVDWSLQKGSSVKALIEIKCRDKSYSSYIISLKKFSEMAMQSLMSNVPFFLVICWPEAGKRVVRYAKVTSDLHSNVIHGGRKDRGDAQDQEPMVDIPINKFKLVGSIT